MYDILQLNDMLVPEFQEISEKLSITNEKKLNKQDLSYKILDSQAVSATEKPAVAEKPKRKRTVKAARVTADNNVNDAAIAEAAPPADQMLAEGAKPAEAPEEKAASEGEDAKKRRKRKPM